MTFEQLRRSMMSELLWLRDRPAPIPPTNLVRCPTFMLEQEHVNRAVTRIDEGRVR